MPYQYYVQEVANNYLRNLTMTDKDVTIHPSFLHGLEKDEFINGLTALCTLTRNLYTDIVANPEAFAMQLKPYVEPDAKNADYTNSAASFTRVPNLLYILGLTGNLRTDGTLVYEGSRLVNTAKEMKITGLPFLLNKLTDYGLYIEGLNKTVKPGDNIQISYPDSPALTAALKSMAEAQLTLNKGQLKSSKNYFYMMHPGLLSHEQIKKPKLTIQEILRTLTPEQRMAAEVLHDNAAAESKQAIRMGGFMRNDWSCVYTANKTGRVLMTLHVNQDKLSAKLNLQNINQYIHTLNSLPPAIMDTLRTSGWECGHCNGSCAGGFAFELDGQAYNKCRGGSFVFNNLTCDIAEHCVTMVKKELAV